MNRFILRVLTGAILALSIEAHAASAAPAKPAGKPADAPAAEKPEKPFGEWKKLIKDARQSKGYFTLWTKRDNLYLELSKD